MYQNDCFGDFQVSRLSNFLKSDHCNFNNLNTQKGMNQMLKCFKPVPDFGGDSGSPDQLIAAVKMCVCVCV